MKPKHIIHIAAVVMGIFGGWAIGGAIYARYIRSASITGA